MEQFAGDLEKDSREPAQEDHHDTEDPGAPVFFPTGEGAYKPRLKNRHGRETSFLKTGHFM